jgi:tetratricopeptide (TPR) repeat protein
MYFNLGRYDAAIRLYQEALDWNKAASRPVDRQTLVMMHNLAAAYFAVHQDREALEWREETLKLRQAKLGTDDPDTLFSMAVLAESLLTRERGTEALAMVDECLRLASGKNVDSRLFPVALATRLRHFEKVKDAAGCRETAEMWEKQNRTDATSLYDAACMRAVTAAVIPRDPKTPDADASRLAKEEADRAISWLQQAVAAGFKDAALLAKDPDLNTLRDRDGFKKLLSEMKK